MEELCTNYVNPSVVQRKFRLTWVEQEKFRILRYVIYSRPLKLPIKQIHHRPCYSVTHRRFSTLTKIYWGNKNLINTNDEKLHSMLQFQANGILEYFYYQLNKLVFSFFCSIVVKRVVKGGEFVWIWHRECRGRSSTLCYRIEGP